MESDNILVDKVIHPSEVFFRCVFSPLHYSTSKKILKREALLPAFQSSDVSMYRKRYISLEECLELAHQITMNNNEFTAIASLKNKMIADLNQNCGLENGTINAYVVYSPMHEDEYVDKSMDVYLGDPNINKPAHVDLHYNQVYSKDSLVKTQLRKYAQHLVNTMEIEYEQSNNQLSEHL